MYHKYSNHVNKYFPFIKQNFHLFIEFSVDFFVYMIHHTVVFKNKNAKTGITTLHIWRCGLIQRHPTSGIYAFIKFLHLTRYSDCAWRENFPLA